jgi:hypothetical protein
MAEINKRTDHEAEGRQRRRRGEVADHNVVNTMRERPSSTACKEPTCRGTWSMRALPTFATFGRPGVSRSTAA